MGDPSILSVTSHGSWLEKLPGLFPAPSLPPQGGCFPWQQELRAEQHLPETDAVDFTLQIWTLQRMEVLWGPHGG